jgi:phage terminase large subunit-like protein
MGELYLANGSRAKVFSSEKPRALRGPQHHVAWGDEPAHWHDAHLGDGEDTTWSNLLLGLRLGAHPRVVLTTTPKPVRLFVGTTDRPGLMKQPTTVMTRGTTYNNLDNLAPTFKASILSKYEGTRLGRQELYAEILSDVVGALWKRENIRYKVAPRKTIGGQQIAMIGVDGQPKQWDPETEVYDLPRIAVAVDPAVTNEPGSDETGILVGGVDALGAGYVLEDRSCRMSPDGWAKRAIQAFLDYKADCIVVETNNGGEMCKLTIQTAARALGVSCPPIIEVHASRGKYARAEPVAALYEQVRIFHTKNEPELEDQLCTWVPTDGRSPDRLDAVVWLFTHLMINGGTLSYGEDPYQMLSSLGY